MCVCERERERKRERKREREGEREREEEGGREREERERCTQTERWRTLTLSIDVLWHWYYVHTSLAQTSKDFVCWQMKNCSPEISLKLMVLDMEDTLGSELTASTICVSPLDCRTHSSTASHQVLLGNCSVGTCTHTTHPLKTFITVEL